MKTQLHKTVRLILCLTALLALTACPGGEPWPADLTPVEHPPTDAMEKASREQIETGRRALDSLLDRGRGDVRELVGTFGDLGEIYQAYELRDAAIACYRNAERLDPEGFLWPYYLGLSHLQEGRSADAIAHFERALELRPGSEPARLRLGEAQLAEGDAEAAKASFGSLVDAFDYRAAARYGLGRALAMSDDHEAAIGQFEESLRAQPDMGVVHHALAASLRRTGDEEKALEHLEKNAGGEPTYPDRLAQRISDLARSSGTFLRRANKELLNGEIEKALDLYREALELAPDSVEIRRNYAIALTRYGNVDEAIAQLNQALESAPDDAGLHFDLANNQLARGFTQQAEESLRKAIESAPDMTQAHFNLANLLVGQERWAESEEPLRRVLKLEPEDSRATYLLAMSEHRQGRSKEARHRLRVRLNQEPADLTMRRGLATIQNEEGRPAEAVRVLDEGLAFDMSDEDRTEALFELAELAWRIGRRDEAVDYSRSSLESAERLGEEKLSDAYTRLANILQVKRDYDEAAELFSRAVELDPSNATARLSEGSLLVLMGEFVRARQSLEAGHEAFPDDLKIQHTLARLLATSPNSSVRDGQRSLELARDVFAKEGSMEHSATVAMSLAELGEYEKAYLWQEGLIRQATMAGLPQNTVRQLVQHLNLYKNQQPLRVSP